MVINAKDQLSAAAVVHPDTAVLAPHIAPRGVKQPSGRALSLICLRMARVVARKNTNVKALASVIAVAPQDTVARRHIVLRDVSQLSVHVPPLISVPMEHAGLY